MGRPKIKLTVAQKVAKAEALRTYNREYKARMYGYPTGINEVVNCEECRRPFRKTKASTRFCDGRELGRSRNYCQRKAWQRQEES